MMKSHRAVVSVTVCLALLGCKDKKEPSPSATPTAPAASQPPSPPAPTESDASRDMKASRSDEALSRPLTALTKTVWRSLDVPSKDCQTPPNAYYDDYIYYSAAEEEQTISWLACKITRGVPATPPIVPGDGLLALLQKLSPVPIYIKSPYALQGELNLTRDQVYPDKNGEMPLTPEQAKTYAHFGHYNPEFVRWFVDHAIPAARDEVFREETQTLYDTHFKETARTYDEVYQKIQAHRPCFEQQVKIYRDALTTHATDEIDYEPWDAWLTEPDICQRDLDVDKTPDSQTILILPAGKAFSFWVRREVDGTGALWYEGLRTLRMTYEPDYISK